MSEEEKKAIETLKEVASDDFDTLGDDISPKMAQNILNVINKKQKEIEEWRNGIRINDKVSIPKDKIRAKIQLYKDKKADSIGMLINYEYWKAKIEILQELLEENNEESDPL